MAVCLSNPRGGEISVSRVELDRYGRWALHYTRGDTQCARPISNTDGIIRFPQKPLGKDLIAAASDRIGGRQLTQAEESAIMNLPIIQ